MLDLAADPGVPLRVVHLGAGALTLARYVAATRPGSRQRAVEISDDVAALVRAQLPLARGVTVPVQVADAREALTRLRDDSADVVVLDVFAGARTPAHLTSVELVREVARVLAPGGLVAANLADGPGLAFVRGQVATYGAVFPSLLAVAEAAVWRGRRFGNVVLAGSLAPAGAARGLDVAGLTRRCAGDGVPARVVAAEELRRFVAGAAVVADATAVDSPEPPPAVFGRR